MKKLNWNEMELLEVMIDDFHEGNDNIFDLGELISFTWDEDERGNPEIYDDYDVEMFKELRKLIIDRGGVVKYTDESDVDYTFEVIGNDIKCSFLEYLEP